MPRPIWSGSISFGLVNVPVKLVSATSPKEVRFHLLHDADGGRIQQKRVCSVDGDEVPWEHVVKGFEISKGRYVPVGKDELESFAPRATRSIEIEDFVDLEQIDPIYYETTYYLLPDRSAVKPYALLLEAMRRTKKVGIARFVLRTREYLCAVRPLAKSLALSTLLHADEVVPETDLEGLPERGQKPGERELKMAEQLVGSLAGPFEIAKYKDEYRAQVLALLEKKAEGEPIVAATAAEPRGKVVSLLDALQKSLAATRAAGSRAAGANDDRHAGPARPPAAARTVRARPRKTPARRRKSG